MGILLINLILGKISQSRIVFNNLGDFGMNWNSNFRYEIDELKIYFNKNILYKKIKQYS